MDLATCRRQDVLARVGAIILHLDDEHCVSLPSQDQIREDNSRYSRPDIRDATTKFHSSIDQIKRLSAESPKHTYTLLLVPRVSTLVQRILEEEGVLGEVTISSYNLQFIPIAEDVVSLELDHAFKEIWVVGPLSSTMDQGLIC